MDRELDDLPAQVRWREWMRRIEAVLFASASPVPREDLMADLEGRSFEIAKVVGGWIMRTRAAYA